MVKKRIHRNPEGVTKELIIQKLSLLKPGEKRRFSDLKNELQITKAMLARHLKELEADRKITSERVGREVFYYLTDKQWNLPETKIHLFSSSLQNFINQDIAGKHADEKLKKLTDEEFVSEFSAKLGLLTLFTIIKSYETNEKWYHAVTQFIQLLSHGGLVYRRLVYPKPGYPIHGNELKDNPVVQAKINELYKAMKKLYPREMKVMEQVFDNPKVLLDPDTGEKISEYTSPPKFLHASKSSLEEAKKIWEKLKKKTS